jgi:hypothetical protein
LLIDVRNKYQDDELDQNGPLKHVSADEILEAKANAESKAAEEAESQNKPKSSRGPDGLNWNFDRLGDA